MRAAKAWRCIIELPDDQVLAAALTALIERHVKLNMLTTDGLNIEIDPAFILDIRTKGRRFHLVIETVWEEQKKHGPYLTSMTGQSVRVSIGKCEQNLEQITTEQKQPRVPKTNAPGKVGPVEITGLHSTFFKNPRFQRYVEINGQIKVIDADSCKQAFKALHCIESTKDLDLTTFREFLRDFNTWINGGAAQCP
jgi:hypothetical protein